MREHRKSLRTIFPAYHPKAGQPTYFVEKVWNSYNEQQKAYCISYYEIMALNDDAIKSSKSKLTAKHVEDFWASIQLNYNTKSTFKHHTIRQTNISKKTGLPLKVLVGDTITFFVWSGTPYDSPQIVISPPIEVKRVWDFEITDKPKSGTVKVNGQIVFDVYGLASIAKNDGLELMDFTQWFKYPKPTGPCQIICWSDTVKYVVPK